MRDLLSGLNNAARPANYRYAIWCQRFLWHQRAL